ncbi:MAG: PAS domain S-box protein [Deltaproteobacteria bacterium]|nr:PAS domain S-box protein [Deltaproteobacteria bacterium]
MDFLFKIFFRKYFLDLERKTNELLRGNRELLLYSQILESMAEGVCLVRARDSVIVYTNSRFEEMFGYEVDELIDRHVSMLNAPTDLSPEDVAKDITSKLNISGFWRGKIFNRKKDGSYFWCRSTISSFNHLEFGKVWIAIHSDISEQKAAEEALRLSEYEIQQRRLIQNALAAQAKELAHSNSDLDQFASAVSHDLKAPLRMVSSYLKLILKNSKENLSEENKEYLQNAIEGTRQMGELIAHLLTYSRSGEGKLQMNEVDLNQTVQKVLKNLKSEVDLTEAEIECESLPIVLSDDLLLSQVLQNLISNALKYRSEKPKIKIHAKCDQHECIIAIKDNGIGIDPKNFERIFMIFQRLHSADEYPGSGVGLAICKKIIEKLGGKIWLESNVGEGSTFFISLASGKYSEVEFA